MPRRSAATLLATLLLAGSTARAQLQPCPAQGNCVEVSVSVPAQPVVRGDAFTLSVQFQPGTGDAPAGGLDNISALTFSLAIPGLELADCANPTADGLTPAISVSSQAAAQFRLIVENTSCDSNLARSCLCPGAGQTRANYVNLALFGPKALAGQEPDTLPSLPAGELLTLVLRAGATAAASVPLHIFSETDNPGTTPKPLYGAQVSIGDTVNVDLSADRGAGVSHIRAVDGQLSVVEPPTPTRTGSATRTSSVTLTPPASATPTRTRTATPTPTATTAAPTSTPATPTRTHTATQTPTGTTPTPTLALATATNTPLPTDTPVVASPTKTPVGPSPTTATSAPSTFTPTMTSGSGEPTQTPTETPPPCVGDCHHTGMVSVEDRVLGVRIALGQLPVSECDAFNVNGDMVLTIDELVAGVKAAIDECQ